MFLDRIAFYARITIHVKLRRVASAKEPVYEDDSQASVLISLVYCYKLGHYRESIRSIPGNAGRRK